MICEAFDVVVVPFPFTDRANSYRRPALVLSDCAMFNSGIGHAVAGHDYECNPFGLATRRKSYGPESGRIAFDFGCQDEAVHARPTIDRSQGRIVGHQGQTGGRNRGQEVAEIPYLTGRRSARASPGAC